jgi:H+-translocating NAD(P) transhydrogenase subunit beta
MTSGLLTGLYLVSAVLFIRSLGGLSTQESAPRGNAFGVVGMILAIVATALQQTSGLQGSAIALLAGALIGASVARRVAMTSMPELVAILHSFVGLAAVLVGFTSAMDGGHGDGSVALHRVEAFLGILVGAVTFTGSIVAWAKLRGSLSGKPLLLPGRHALNATLLVASLVLCVMFAGETDATRAIFELIGMLAIASFLGVHLVAAIGGADMPVVVSLLNSYSGWAAAAAGFMLENDLLIVTGALVGSSGAILSIIMCRAMNRSIWNVVFGGFGADPPKGAAAAQEIQGEVREIDANGVAELLESASQIVVVPGYGMAVSHAQSPLYEIATILRKRKKTFRFAIHPVAGRLPGHMNVLLAEARVPYDIVLEMDEINPDFKDTEVVLVVGANDIVNPAAQTDTSSPIFGMPVLEVWNAKNVIVTKRGMAAGYAGIENPLFFRENTRMLFGDAKKTIDQVLAKIRDDT